MLYCKCKVEIKIMIKYTPTSKTTKILNNTTNNSTLISELNLTKTTCLIKILPVDKTDKWKANKNPEEQNAQWTKL